MNAFGGHHLMHQREQPSSSPKSPLPSPPLVAARIATSHTGQDSERPTSLAQCIMGFSALQSLPVPASPAHTGSLVLAFSLLPLSHLHPVPGCLLQGSENIGVGIPSRALRRTPAGPHPEMRTSASLSYNAFPQQCGSRR